MSLENNYLDIYYGTTTPDKGTVPGQLFLNTDTYDMYISNENSDLQVLNDYNARRSAHDAYYNMMKSMYDLEMFPLLNGGTQIVHVAPNNITTTAKDPTSPVQQDSLFAKSPYKAIVLPSTLTTLGGDAFFNCTELVELILPPSVTKILDWQDTETEGGDIGPFENCYNLTNLEIPYLVKRLPNYCFKGCYNLRQIHLPDTLRVLGEYCFVNCIALGEIKLPSALQRVEKGCFKTNTDTRFNIPRKNIISHIGAEAFSQQAALSEFWINPKTINYIGANAFAESYSCNVQFDSSDEFRCLTDSDTLYIHMNAFNYTAGLSSTFVFPKLKIDSSNDNFSADDCEDKLMIDVSDCDPFNTLDLRNVMFVPRFVGALTSSSIIKLIIPSGSARTWENKLDGTQYNSLTLEEA